MRDIDSEYLTATAAASLQKAARMLERPASLEREGFALVLIDLSRHIVAAAMRGKRRERRRRQRAA